MNASKWLCIMGALGSVSACGHAHDPAGHDHEHGDHGHAEAEEAPSLAITRWTNAYELFVELPSPVPGKPIPFHAHVTRLADFAAVTQGTFHVRFKTAAGVAQEATQAGVKRPGIFVFEVVAPAAGVYALEMSYERDGESDVFDCGSITVTDPPAVVPESPGSTITFLKESQWKIPFGTAWAAERPLAKELEVTGTIEPAANDQLTIGAPTGGRFFHSPKLALAEGLRVKKGDVIGSIVPTVAGDDFSRLQIAVDEAQLSKAQLQRELQRVEPLVNQGLLPERRLIELRNQLDTQSAKLGAATARVSSVASPGGANALTIRSSLDGVVSQVLVPNGEPVAAGAALVRLGGASHLWIRSRFVAKPAVDLLDARPSRVRLASGEEIDLQALGARFLSALPVVDPSSRIATWLVDIPAPAHGATEETVLQNLRVGTSVVLLARFGEPQSLLAVPRGAVVEINTRPYVFVQVDGEHFEKRPVELGRAEGPWVAISTGVAKGDRVVTHGGFDIHLASLMGTIESHRH